MTTPKHSPQPPAKQGRPRKRLSLSVAQLAEQTLSQKIGRRAAKQASLVVIEPCPECLASGLVSPQFQSAAERGRHRWGVHKLAGTSFTARNRRQQIAKLAEQGEQAFVATGSQSIALHRGFVPSLAKENKDFAMGFCFSKCVDILQDFSTQSGIPAAQVATEFAKMLASPPN